VAVGGVALAQDVDLIGDASAWTCGTDGGGATMALQPTPDAKLACAVNSDGGAENYPKLTLAFGEPQDWQKYMRVRARLRVTSPDPTVTEKSITFVFYDANTLREDLPDRPMTQQCIGHSVPVGKWVDLSDWLLTIHRSAIRQIQLYVYEVPTAAPHAYTWEIADLRLEGVGEQAVAFDTEIYARGKLTGATGKAVGSAKTDDGLTLTLGSRGEIADVLLDGRSAGKPADQPTGLLLRDVAAGDPPVMVGGQIDKRPTGVSQSATLKELGLRVEAEFAGKGPYVSISGRLSNLRDEDRAVTLYFAVPVADAPWQWWDSVATPRTSADATGELSYLETGVQYGLNGCHSKYPLGAVSWPDRAGLSLAIRMDQPVVHRLAYNPDLHLFYLALDFGLLPAGDPKHAAADFSLLLYRHDPAWGFRSALQRYYDLFPDSFTKRVQREGGWYVWGDVSSMPEALDAGFGFHWGPASTEAVKWDNEHGVLPVLYIEPEFFQETLGDFDRAPTPAEAIGRLEKLAAGDEAELAKMEKLSYAGGYAPANWTQEHSLREALQTISRAAVASVLHGPTGEPYANIGEMPWMGESKWGCIFPCDLDPDLPGGKGPFNTDIYLEYNLKASEEAGAPFAGIGLDSFGGYGQAQRADYRREHFAYGSAPLSFAAVEHVPVQVAAFQSVEWLRALAEKMHGRKLVLMTNCSWGITPGWLTFAAPYLDIFGAEAPQFADPDFIRAIAYRKPCTDLPYTPRPEWEVAWHLLHDIHPGHGNDVAVMAKHAELLRELSRAGWEPITNARVEPRTVRVERYGGQGQTYFVLHNPSREAVTATLTTNAAALGKTDLKATLLPGDEPLTPAANAVSVSLDAQGTRVVSIR
jgi:hypothetical protein